MGHESEHGPVNPEVGQEKSGEAEGSPIDSLPESLGFTETEELRQIRGELVEAMAGGADTVELTTNYQSLGEEEVGKHEGIDFSKAQIGLIVQMALIRRDGGRWDACLNDLQDALTYAENMGFTDLVPTLETAITDLGLGN